MRERTTLFPLFLLRRGFVYGGVMTLIGFFLPWYAPDNFVEPPPNGWGLFRAASTSIHDSFIFLSMFSLIVGAGIAILLGIDAFSEHIFTRLARGIVSTFSILLLFFVVSRFSGVLSDTWLFPLSSPGASHGLGYDLALLGGGIVWLCAVFSLVSRDKGILLPRIRYPWGKPQSK